MKSIHDRIEECLNTLHQWGYLEDKFTVNQDVRELLQNLLADYGAEKYLEGTREERKSWTGRV